MSPKSSKLLSLTCPLCGKDFTRYPSQIKEGAIAYCSGACYHAARRDNALPTQWRENISKATRGKPKPPGFAKKATGRRLTDEVRKERKARMAERGTLPTGERHYGWKGGIVPKPFARFDDPRYAQWREAVFTRDQRTCQQCGRVFVRGQKGLHAHHLKPYAKYLDVRYATENGVALCTRCHNGYHRLVAIEEYERMEQVPCACGCGGLIYPIGMDGRRRRFIRGHGLRGKAKSPETRARISASLMGRKLAPFTDEHKRRISEGRKGIGKGVPSPNKGWRNTYMTQAAFIAAYAVLPSTEIAAQCHVSPASVTHWAKSLGLPARYGDGGTGLLKPRSALAAGQWGPGRESCVLCGTTELPHKGHGLCSECYGRQRTLRRNPDAQKRPKRAKPECPPES